jgi:hypothetical protein
VNLWSSSSIIIFLSYSCWFKFPARSYQFWEREGERERENHTSAKSDDPNIEKVSIRDSSMALIFELLDATRAVVVVNLLVLQQWHFSLRHLLSSISTSGVLVRNRNWEIEMERERGGEIAKGNNLLRTEVGNGTLSLSLWLLHSYSICLLYLIWFLWFWLHHLLHHSRRHFFFFFHVYTLTPLYLFRFAIQRNLESERAD